LTSVIPNLVCNYKAILCSFETNSQAIPQPYCRFLIYRINLHKHLFQFCLFFFTVLVIIAVEKGVFAEPKILFSISPWPL